MKVTEEYKYLNWLIICWLLFEHNDGNTVNSPHKFA